MAKDYTIELNDNVVNNLREIIGGQDDGYIDYETLRDTFNGKYLDSTKLLAFMNKYNFGWADYYDRWYVKCIIPISDLQGLNLKETILIGFDTSGDSSSSYFNLFMEQTDGMDGMSETDFKNAIDSLDSVNLDTDWYGCPFKFKLYTYGPEGEVNLTLEEVASLFVDSR